VVLPLAPGDGTHVYHLYVIRTARRDALREFLASAGVQSSVHYPRAVHEQPAFAAIGTTQPPPGHGPGSCPQAGRAAGEILSLPLFPYLTSGEVEQVSHLVRSFVTRE
jgi:dTDP-4-amino-4,6-dideoxygalactose transaminase